MNLKINHLQHVGIPVTEIRQSELFYERLGFSPVMRSTFRYEGSEGTVSMMKRGTIMLELYQMPEPELTRVRQRRDGHIDHIAFDVNDIDETNAWLREEGFTVLEEKPVYLNFWENGCKYLYILGPDGERLEFCQIP
jgi:lactoylglutathione lyase